MVALGWSLFISLYLLIGLGMAVLFKKLDEGDKPLTILFGMVAVMLFWPVGLLGLLALGVYEEYFDK